MAITKNSAALAVGYNINTPNPIDARTVVDNKQDLIDAKSWGTDYNQYKGLITYVKDDNAFYALTGDTKLSLIQFANASSDEKNTAYNQWTKISTADDLKNLGGVFQFQGVASAIDADHCTLTIGTPTFNNIIYKVWTYRVDVEGDTYMFWADASAKTQPSTGYWLRDPFQNGSMTYTLSSTKANILIYNQENYYETSTVVNNRTQYLSLDGKDIWVNETDVYETSDSTTKLTTTPTPAGAHDVYFFTESTKLKDVTQASGPGNAVQALPSNKGHVYQLGEEEYASNGTIWVQLGSPKEDWIVIK